MTPEEVMARYEAAASAHDLSATIRLIDPEALYWFSNTASHVGRAAVELAIKHNFDNITDENYRIENLRWIARSDELAVLNADRKSTRLNSSHQIISYAVFCLKKKT